MLKMRLVLFVIIAVQSVALTVLFLRGEHNASGTSRSGATPPSRVLSETPLDPFRKANVSLPLPAVRAGLKEEVEGQEFNTAKTHLAGAVAQSPSQEATSRRAECKNSADGEDDKPISDPLIFVGGVPSSGTTLMRVLLDAHPDIRCGEETRLVPRLLMMMSRLRSIPLETKRLEEAGITGSLIDTAFKKMFETIIVGHGSYAKYLCDKDPLALKSMTDLERLFPTAKFILMIRDGRATTNSIMTRKVTIAGVDIKQIGNVMDFWQKCLTDMIKQCDSVGSGKCLQVYYEKLVTSPKVELERLMRFLNIPLHEDMLRHHLIMLNKTGEISTSR